MDLRGNLNTRLRKLRELDLNAIVIAGAGLKRMGEEDRITEIIPFSTILPAAGQGALGIEIREGKAEIKEIVANLDDRDSHVETEAERSFLEKLGGGCQVPVGALGQLKKGNLSLQGIILSLDGQGSVQSELSGKAEEARNLGERLAEELLASGGAEMLKAIS